MIQPDEIVHAATLIRDELPRLLGDRAARVDARLAELLNGVPEEVTDQIIVLLRAYPETRRWLRAYLDRPDGEKSLPPDRDDSAGVEHGDEACGSGWPGETAVSDPWSGGPYTGGGTSQARRRYLKGQCPDSVPVGKPFSLLVSIVMAGPASAGLKPFDVPPEGRDVLLVVHAPGLRLLGRSAPDRARAGRRGFRAGDVRAARRHAGAAAGVRHGLDRRQLPR